MESKARIFVVAQLYIPKLRRWTSRATSTDGSRSPCASGRPAWDVTALGKAWETPGSWARETGWIRDWSSNIAGSLKLSLFSNTTQIYGTKGLVFREGISEEHGCHVAQPNFCEFWKEASALEPRRGCLNFPLMTTSYPGGALFPRLDQHIVLLMGSQKSGNHQLRLVVYGPVVYRVFDIPGGDRRIFFHQQLLGGFHIWKQLRPPLSSPQVG